MFWKKNKFTFPAYFRCGNVFVKVTAKNAYLKSFVTKDGTHGELSCTTEIATTQEVFQSSNGWKEITESAWIKHMEFVCAPRASSKNEKPIKFVAECGGRQYFTFETTMDMPAGRFREMEIIFTEYEARCSREYLMGAFGEINAILDNPKEIKMSRIAAIARESLGRMSLLYDFNLYEKLASVMFFDDAEDLSLYDTAYNQAKIAHWRESGGISFFLALPIADLLPFGKISESDFQNFLKQQTAKLRLIQAGLPPDAKSTSTEFPQNLSNSPSEPDDRKKK